MLPYMLVGALLWAITLNDQNSRSATFGGTVCLIVLIAFTGLRYEIGYDWLAYEQYFTWLNPVLSLDNYRISQTVLPVEILYFAFNVLVKFFGGSFELLLFIISCFNLIVIDRVVSKIDQTSRPFVWLMYLCLALIMVQFNIIRQGIASSFVLIALMSYCEKKRAKSFTSWLFALGFHTSSALFIPIVPFIHRQIKQKYILVILLVSSAIFIVGNVFLASALNAISGFLPGGISEKTDSYATGIAGGAVWGISPLAAILIVMYLFALRVFMRLPRDPYVNVAILLTVAVLIAHIAFGRVPIIWNRIMCVSLPWQLAVVWKYYIREVSPDFRRFGLIVGGLGSLAVFAFQLTRPENIAFVPYHSLAQVWLFNDQGDGRLRSLYAVQQGQMEDAQRATQ